MAFLIRLLALAALILMPVGMGTAAVAAAAPASHAVADKRQDGHCQRHIDQEAGDAAAMACGGLCSALPVEPDPVVVAARASVARAGAARAGALDGVMPPLSTPPPRLG